MTIKSIKMEMNAARMLTAIIELEGQKQPITACALVMYTHSSNSYVYARYSLSTSEDFTMIGDSWDIVNATETHSPLMEAVWKIMQPMLELNCPKPLTLNEQAEKDNNVTNEDYNLNG